MANLKNIWLYMAFYILFKIQCCCAKYHPDAFLNLEGRVKRHGYPFEVHKVITDDGYILSLYRIPYGLGQIKEDKNKSAVLLQHGMGASAIYWTSLGPKDSIPYYFADRGFDVWISTARGVQSTFDQHHVKLDWDKNSEYWQYSLHEIGKYDLKGHIDYITTHTNQSKVFYIGHSAGVPEFFILLSERPEYNEKIKIGAMYGLAPIINRIDNPPLQLFCSLSEIVKIVTKMFDIVEVFPPVLLTTARLIIRSLCNDKHYYKICVKLVALAGTHRSVLQEDDLIGVIASEQPQRTSLGVVFHFLDNINRGDFRKFDYGPKENMKVYGQKLPPLYNLSSSSAHVAFFHSEFDHLGSKWDAYDSINHLENVILDYEVPYKGFTHTDFVFARNATNLVYEQTVKLFKNFDSGLIPPKVGIKVIPAEEFRLD